MKDLTQWTQILTYLLTVSLPSFLIFQTDHESCFLNNVKVREMLNPQRNPPLVHVLLVLGINWFSRMAVELVKMKLKT